MEKDISSPRKLHNRSPDLDNRSTIPNGYLAAECTITVVEHMAMATTQPIGPSTGSLGGATGQLNHVNARSEKLEMANNDGKLE